MPAEMLPPAAASRPGDKIITVSNRQRLSRRAAKLSQREEGEGAEPDHKRFPFSDIKKAPSGPGSSHKSMIFFDSIPT